MTAWGISRPLKRRSNEADSRLITDHCSLTTDLWHTERMGNKDKGKKEAKKAPKPKPKPEPSQKREIFTPPAPK